VTTTFEPLTESATRHSTVCSACHERAFVIRHIDLDDGWRYTDFLCLICGAKEQSECEAEEKLSDLTA